MNLIALIGRLLLASIFAASGVVKLVAYGEVRDVLIAHYLETSASFGAALVIGSGLLELLGAGLVILGFRTRWGVAALVVALIPATFIYHLSVGEENQVVHLLKNASILGGLLLLWVLGPGDLSLDRKLSGTRTR